MRTIPEKIRIEIMTHRPSGLMVAVSPDVPGLYVHGKNEEEITLRIPVAVKALRDADVIVAARKLKLPAGFSKEKSYDFPLVAA